MPGGDGTGPLGQGPGTGRGGGRGGGGGQGSGGGQGRMGGNRPGAGPLGFCICPSCGEKATHQTATPCYNIACPKCGAKMIRG